MVRRRQFLAGSVTAGALVLSGCSALDDRDPDLDGEWTQVSQAATNTNYAPNVTMPDSLVEQWRRRIGTWPYVPPVVAEGTVVSGGSRGLFAFDPADGTELWHREFDAVAHGTAVLGDSVLVPEHRREGPHSLHALALEDGSDRWTVEFERRPFAPTVRDGRVFLRTDDECLELAEGEVLWRSSLSELSYEEYNAENLVTDAGPIKPAVTEDLVVVPDRHAVVALDPDDGSKLWREELHGINASPVVDEGQVVALGLDSVVEFHADGAERWRAEEGRWGALAVAEGEVYVLGANELTALDRQDGSLVWSELVTGDVVHSPPTVLGDAVLTVTRGGVAFRRDPGLFQDRELLWLEAETTSFHDSGSAVVGAGGVFAIEGQQGSLVAFGPGE